MCSEPAPCSHCHGQISREGQVPGIRVWQSRQGSNKNGGVVFPGMELGACSVVAMAHGEEALLG